MPTDEELKIVITAIDNASAVLKQVAANNAEASTQMSAANDEAGMSFSSLVGSIVSAQVAYEALAKAYELVKGFFEESIQASISQSATMAQVKVNVDNAGLSYNALLPQLDAVAKANEQLGFQNDDTYMSMSKLILATGDYDQALKLNQLAMDLSRAKGIDLNSATVLLQQVMAGNTRVMKQYGISLDSATTSAEALNLLQSKLQGSASAFAETSAGQMAEMQAQWGRIQEEVGDQFMPLLKELFNAFEANLPQITADINYVANGVVDLVQLVKDLVTIGQEIAPFFEDVYAVLERIYVPLLAIRESIQMIGAVVDAQAKASAAQDTAASVAQKLQDKYKQLADAYNAVNKATITATDLSGTDAKSTQLLTDAKAALAKQNGTAGTSFDDITNRIKAANTAVLKHSDAIAKLQTDYKKMQTEGATDLATLSDDFKTKMKSISDSIAKTQQSIKDLTSSYNDTQKSDTQSVAESIVASQQKIADLKKQLAAATTADERKNLQDQLDTEQKNYDSSAAFRSAHSAEIAAATVRAGETDLQRTIDDYNTKEALDTADYQKKLLTLQQELVDKATEAVSEITLYKSRRDQINKILDEGNAYFIKLSKQRSSQTTQEVQDEIAQFQALGAAIQATKGASKSAIGTVNIPQFETGGVVNAPRGTAVPAILHGGERILTPEQQGKGNGSGDTYIFNFTGAVAGDDGIKTIITKTIQTLNRGSQLRRISAAR